jgi:circadian clock protein KaiB
MAKDIKSRPRLLLRLYVAGNAPNSILAIANLKAVCDAHYAAGHELEIVDMLRHPQRAIADQIVATPTLLRLLPLPVRRVIGDLSDTSKLLLLLANA